MHVCISLASGGQIRRDYRMRWLFYLTLSFVFPFFAAGQSEADARPPNILVLFTDDQGWGDLSSHGNPRLETPNLDRLGTESMRFTQFTVNPACAPTRASLLTGRHYHLTGVWGVHGGRDFLNLDEILIGELLQKAGYRTGMIGKWHNGKSGPYLPRFRGFDEVWYKQGLYRHAHANFLHNGKPLALEGWARDRMGEFAIDFMRSAGDQPFFLYVAFPTPHLPIGAPDSYVEKYRAKDCSEAHAQYYAMVDHLDTVIGNILEGVDELGLREETVVIFLTDNGPTSGKATEAEFAERNPKGWRGRKGQIWENGVHVPLFVRWPGRVEPGENSLLTHVTDLFPTFAELAGASTETLRKPLEGRSLLPLLQGEKPAAFEERYIYNAAIVPRWEGQTDPHDYLRDREKIRYADQVASVKHRQYKLVKTGSASQPYELYNLEDDPGATRDLSGEEPEMAATMRARLDAWFRPIIEDPATYRMPSQAIGWGDSGEDNLYLNCAVAMSPGVVSYIPVTEIDEPGDYVELMVEILRPGRYEVTTHGTLYEGAKWRVELGAATLESTAFGKGDVSLGEISVEETGQRLLRLELLESPETGPAMKDLFTMKWRLTSE